MTNALELSQYIGRTAELAANELTILVHIMNAKKSYGCTRYLVTPVSGSGQVWVDSSRIKFQDRSDQ